MFFQHRGSYAADRGSSWKANQAGDLGFKPKLNGPGGPAGWKAGQKPGMWPPRTPELSKKQRAVGPSIQKPARWLWKYAALKISY
jgi:hypothetical protein